MHILMKFLFLLLPLVYLAGNAYLFLRTWQSLSCLPLWCRIAIGAVFCIAAFSLFAAVGLRDAGLPDVLLKSMSLIGSVWMAFLLYMVLLLLVFDVARCFVPNMKHSLLYALSLTMCILGYGYFNYKHPKVHHFDIDLEYEGPQMRIVAISDVHLGYGTGVSALKKYVKQINGLNPDVIVIAGDLIDNSVRPLYREPFADVLSSLKAPMGIYMVPGNHEYISGIGECMDFLDRTSVTLLRDSVVTLSGGIQIVGRDDFSNHRRKSLEDLLASTDRTQPVIVLDHQPYNLSEVNSLGVDFQISGHTHHGQLWPLNLVTDHIFEQSHGYRKWSHSHIWVSSGLSLWGPPFRIGTDSDIAIFDLK